MAISKERVEISSEDKAKNLNSQTYITHFFRQLRNSNRGKYAQHLKINKRLEKRRGSLQYRHDLRMVAFQGTPVGQQRHQG